MAIETDCRPTFQELIDQGSLEIGDGYRAKNSELGGDGIIFLRAGHVSDTHINFEDADRFHAELREKVRNKIANAGDTVVTTKGNSTGRTSFVTKDMPDFVYSPHLSYWRSLDEKKIARGFLRYWSQSKEFVNQLSGMKVSTDMAPYLSLTDQRRLRIKLLPIKQQKAIAHILGSLDDKIEVNRRMNETLEAMARAIFQCWFVDFEPVKAKAAGATSFTGMPQDVFDQLPASFEPSELGEIPTGWEVVAFSEIADLIGGGTPKRKEPSYWSGKIPWFSVRDAPDECDVWVIDTEDKVTQEGIANSSAKDRRKN